MTIADRLARIVPALGRTRRSLWRKERPLVWAHRGASAHATENTIAAFELAKAHGADGIELDVFQCGTGEVVVFHDEDLGRLGVGVDPALRAPRLPWADLGAIELRGGHRIPLLADALRATDLMVNVELKSFRPARPGALPAAVARVIADAGAAERVVVSSFDPVMLWQLHRVAPHLPIGFLFETGAVRPLRNLGGVLGASSLHPHHPLCTPEAIAGWHERGFAVHTWTVDDPDRLRALSAAGIDGVFANDPRAARAVLEAQV